MRLLTLILLTTIIFSMTEKSDLVGLHETDRTSERLFSFGVIADVQYADIESAGTRYYRYSPDKLREALDSFRMDQVDFVINLGDLIDRDFKSFDLPIRMIGSSGLNIFHCIGNHDYMVAPELKAKLPLFDRSKTGYFSFTRENVRFIFLNGNELSTYASNDTNSTKFAYDYISGLRKSGEINGMEWNGGISDKQLKWLGIELDKALSAGEKVIIICHFPVFPEDVHNLLNYKDVLQILARYGNILAWFSGHNHAGNYGQLNNAHFVTFRGMVETESENSYACVEVYRDKIMVRGSGREKSQTLEY